MIRKNSVFLIAVVIALAASATPAAELHVGPGQTHTTIQPAIDAAVDGDTVIVADGVYTGDGNRDIDFKGRAITVRSENGAKNCVINCQGTRKNPHRGFIFQNGEDETSRLVGVTIRDGWALDEGGGGIYCVDSGPDISECIIKNCVSAGTDWPEVGRWGHGGGIMGSKGPITGCVIVNNDAGFSGGGLAGCDGPISNCVISGNSAWGYEDEGGGLLGCDGVISNCVIIGNRSDGSGAGASKCGTLVNCIIRNNYGRDPFEQLYQVDSVTYCNLQQVWEGEGNFYADPLFVSLGLESGQQAWIDGDYHLKSEAGRWEEIGHWDEGGTPADPNDDVWVLEDRRWVYDDVTSPCIDAGDPNSAWQGEFWPHGGVLNMGAYGGTREASMSLSEVGNVADLDYDGGVGFLDFGLFAGQWGFDAAAWWAQSPPYRGDLDRDGFVGLADLAVLVEEWASD